MTQAIQIGDIVNHSAGGDYNPATVVAFNSPDIVTVRFTGGRVTPFTHTCGLHALTLVRKRDAAPRYGPYKPIAKALPG